jgi:hypothetical protein
MNVYVDVSITRFARTAFSSTSTRHPFTATFTPLPSNAGPPRRFADQEEGGPPPPPDAEGAAVEGAAAAAAAAADGGQLVSRERGADGRLADKAQARCGWEREREPCAASLHRFYRRRQRLGFEPEPLPVSLSPSLSSPSIVC